MSITKYDELVLHKREGRTQWQLRDRHHTLFAEPNGSSKTIGSIDPKDPYYLTGEFFVTRARTKGYSGRSRYPGDASLSRAIWIRVVDRTGACGWIMTSVTSRVAPSNLDDVAISKLIDETIVGLTMPERTYLA